MADNESAPEVDEFGFTAEEREIADLILEAGKKYLDLVAADGKHRDVDPDVRLWMPAYDTLIDQLFARVVRRDYPAWTVGYGYMHERGGDG